ncbi:MAG: glycosyltransferase [Planctomycetes bacterium]|nr:glycosyltransferase [Planctomycetota bacterium]
MKTLTTSLPPSGASPASETGVFVSAVAPVYNEEANLAELHDRLTKALASLGRPWEIVYVDDGSADGSLGILTRLATDPRVRVVEFARNFGQHAAVFAGLAASSGEIVVTLDADLQNPPEEIPKLVAKMQEGYDVVGSRRRRRKDPVFRRAASRIINRLAGGHMSDYGCMLRAYRRPVVDQIGRCQEISSFIPLLAMQYARRCADIEVEHAERARGKTKYGFFKLVNLQFDLMTGFSMLPLRVMTYFGGFVAASAFLLAVFILVMRVVYGSEWAAFGVFTLFAALFMMVGFLFVALGVLGEYVGRIYAEVRRRPRYVVRQIHGGPPA